MTRLSDRGVSEVVSFVLVFSIVITTIGVVYASGFSGLDNVQENERITNAERAFDVLADNMEDIHGEGAPSRATEIKLSGAQLSATGTTRLEVNITNLGSPISYSKELSPIVYSAGTDSEIVYEAGAVIRTDGDSGIIKEQPPFQFRKDGATRQAIIPVIQTRSSGVASIGGSTTVLVRGERSVRKALTARPDPSQDSVSAYDITLTFDTTPTRGPLWADYFNEQITWGDPCTETDGTVTCSLTVDELYVTWTAIDVEIQN